MRRGRGQDGGDSVGQSRRPPDYTAHLKATFASCREHLPVRKPLFTSSTLLAQLRCRTSAGNHTKSVGWSLSDAAACSPLARAPWAAPVQHRRKWPGRRSISVHVCGPHQHPEHGLSMTALAPQRAACLFEEAVWSARAVRSPGPSLADTRHLRLVRSPLRGPDAPRRPPAGRPPAGPGCGPWRRRRPQRWLPMPCAARAS